MDFVHLHVHSHHTAEDGVAGVRDLVRLAAEHGQKAMALTDLHTLAGVPELVSACREFSLRAVIGCEFQVASLASRVAVETPFRLVLLAETEIGYRNLTALVALTGGPPESNAGRQRRRRAGLAPDQLAAHAAGLLAMSGTPGSELNALLGEGRLDETQAHVNHLGRIFGPANMVLSIHDHGGPRQRAINDRVSATADYLRVPCVATNTVGYLRPEDSLAHAFVSGKRPPDYVDFATARDPRHSRHVAHADQMRAKFPRHPKAIFGSAEVAARCAFQPVTAKRRFPREGYGRGLDADSFLWDLAFREARERFPELTAEVKARLNVEFDAIKQAELADPLLLLWNISKFCRTEGIVTGVGRGSLASSLVAHVLGLTRVNPLDHRLVFQRFEDFGAVPDDAPVADAEPGADATPPPPPVGGLRLRVETPSRHGARVRQWLAERLGDERCAVVGSSGWVPRESLAKSVRAWFDQPPGADTASGATAGAAAALAAGPDSAMESFFPPRAPGAALPCPEAVAFMLSRLWPRPGPLAPDANEIAVSGDPLGHVCPVLPAGGEPRVTQFDGPGMELFQVPRIRFGHDGALDVLDGATEWVRRQQHAKFDPDRIPLDNPETFDLLCRGQTSGIAAFEAVTMRSFLRANRPRNFIQLVAEKSKDRGPAPQSEDADATPSEPPADIVPDCLMAYRNAFLKVHYPLAFATALLTQAYGAGPEHRRRFLRALRETVQAGIRVLPPDVNVSEYGFSMANGAITTGLMVAQGLGEAGYADLEKARKGGNFAGLDDLIRRTDPSLVTDHGLADLVKTGALDGLSAATRTSMLSTVARRADDIRRGGAPATEPRVEFPQAALLAEARAFRQAALPPPQASDPEETLRMERQAAGYAISQDEIGMYGDIVARCRALAPGGLTARMVGRDVYMAGFIDDVEQGSPLVESASHLLLDLEGHVVTMPEKAARQYSAALSSNDPVLLGGKVARRKDEVYLKATTAFTLDHVRRMAEQVALLDIDLAGLGVADLWRLHGLARRFGGGDTVLRAPAGPGASIVAGWFAGAISRTAVFFCPPFHDGLRRILGASADERIHIAASPGIDGELLHALDPSRFAKPGSRQTDGQHAVAPVAGTTGDD